MAPKKKPAHGLKAKGGKQGAHRPPKEVSGAAGSRGPSEPSSRSEAPQYEAVGGEWVVCQKQARSQRAEAAQKASRASTVQKARQPAAAAASKAGQTASACVRQPGYGKGRALVTSNSWSDRPVTRCPAASFQAVMWSLAAWAARASASSQSSYSRITEESSPSWVKT